MKNKNIFRFNDEIRGKESEDYTEEFSPKRLKFPQFFEDSETVFDLDEEKTIPVP